MLTRGVTVLLTLTCAVASAHVYLLQPVLVLVGRDFGVSESMAAVVPVAMQLGYVLGMVLLVPLGDVRDRRPLVLGLAAATTGALFATACAPNLPWLVVSGAVVGLCTPLAQVVLPLVVAWSDDPRRRARVVGIVQAGILVGLLASRTASGFLGQWFGWRAVPAVAATVLAGVWILLWWRLPSAPPSSSAMPYTRLLGSLPGLLARPVVRRVCVSGLFVGVAFGAFWNTLSFALAREFGYGPAVSGLFGVVAATSAIGSPLTGRLVDRRGARTGQWCLLAVAVLGWLVLAGGPWWVGWFVVGTIALDVGVWGNQVVNQAVLFGLEPECHSRANTLHAASRFAGIAVGSSVGAWLWSQGGWSWVAAGGLLSLAVATPFAVCSAPRRNVTRPAVPEPERAH